MSAVLDTRRSMHLTVVLGGLFAFAVATPSWGEAACADVPDARRAQCERVMDCMEIDDRDVRRACIAAAQREPSQTERVTERDSRPIEPATRRSEPVVREEPAVAPAPVEEVEPVQEPVRVAEPRRQAERAPETARFASIPAPPLEFKGIVTKIFDSVQERKLIAVDHRYLFESNLAGHGRFKEGHSVSLKKTSSRFGMGRSWRMTGPTGMTVDAFRIRCEQAELGRNNRQRCDRMLGR